MFTFVICMALQFEDAWCRTVDAIKRITWDLQNFHSTCWNNKVSLKPWHQTCKSVFCLLCKAKYTSLKNFSCLTGGQRYAVLIKSFSVYLGSLCASLSALANTQYQPISRFVTSSSQIVSPLAFFFSLSVDRTDHCSLRDAEESNVW